MVTLASDSADTPLWFHVPLLVLVPGDYLKSLRETDLDLELYNPRILRIKMELVGEVSCCGSLRAWSLVVVVRDGAAYWFRLEVDTHG